MSEPGRAPLAALRRALQPTARTTITVTRVVGEHPGPHGETLPETVVVTTEPVEETRPRLRVSMLILGVTLAAVTLGLLYRLIRRH